MIFKSRSQLSGSSDWRRDVAATLKENFQRMSSTYYGSDIKTSDIAQRNFTLYPPKFTPYNRGSI